MGLEKITIQLAQVANLESFTINKKTLSEFLKSKDLEYDSSVRVNGVIKKESYKLRDTDIITVVGEVSGGE